MQQQYGNTATAAQLALDDTAPLTWSDITLNTGLALREWGVCKGNTRGAAGG